MKSRLNLFVAFVAGASMGAMMLLTIADAVGRYAFNRPIPGAIEYISYLLGLLIFSGFVLVTRDRSHIAVGMVAELLPRAYRRFEALLSAVATFAGCCLVVWLTIDQTRRYARSGIAGEASHIPVAAVVSIFIVFAVIAALFALFAIFRSAADKSALDGDHGL